MTNEELAVRIKDGECGLISALWNQCEKLINFHANSLYRRCYERCAFCGVTVDDICQVCFFALLDAVKAFDMNEGYKFTTYLGFRIKKHFCQLIRYGRAKQDAVDYSLSVDVPVSGTEDESDVTYKDNIQDISSLDEYDTIVNNVFNQQLRDALEIEISKLPVAHSTVIRKRFFQGISRERLINESGRSPSYVTRLETDSYSRLRRSLNLQRFRNEILETTAYKHKGIKAFRRDGSTVETAVLRAEELTAANE